MAQLVSRHSCVANKLPVVVRFPAGPRVSLKWSPAEGKGRRPKSKCTKHTNVGPLLEVEMSQKCTPLWREAHFQVKMYKTPHGRTTFGSSDVEKVHAVVARSTFPSQNVQNTPFSDYFWTLRCRKSVEKVYAVVARSTFRSQTCQKLRVLSLF